ncbi:lysine-specific demethylase 2A [Boleophthalmus pectinirostris]|uniref:lysine-specific demethylase 2A n=1 Tax=Boleophthalmus pectinirostris TaxID=150288 RepID=UPI00242DB79D|nr:lysine-specific demethylase 2A [Boleophthalmus pectinirostris]
MEDPNTRYSKRLRTGTRRRYQDDGISDDEIEGKRTFDLDEKLLSDRFTSDLIKYMDGKDFTFEYIQKEGLKDPIVFKKSDGLGIQMPDPDFSVSDVKVFVGSRRIVDVMDVNTQKGIEMSMAQWGRYYETPPSEREKLYNVISLEFSHTKLENLVKRPASVDLIDWVDNMWPRHLKERQTDSTNAIIDMHYPKVQKYCLMSVQGCFTDFHIDFGGTSVWYHILRGRKVFWLIPPSPQNLEMYENWVLSGKQGDIFLGDKCHDCQRIELQQGYTFMIPSGWIHAVYTPEDTLVFGGNFLHSFNIPMQLNIYSIEDRTRVPAKFRYPFYYEMCWYVLERYLYCLTNTSHLTPEFQKYSLGIGLSPDDVNGNDATNEVPNSSDMVDVKVKEEVGETDVAVPETKPKYVLTPLELEGLWNLLGKLEELPAHKKCVPAGIEDAAALLQNMRDVLLQHADDDPTLSYTGEPIVKWPERPSWYEPPLPPPPPSVLYRPRLGPSGHKTRRSTKRSISALRRRRVRCKRCAACRRKECGSCQFCHDMRKFGGPGRMKKSCVMRQCLAPALPNTARCAICEEGEPEESNPSTHTLMECSVCNSIVHPRCIKEPGEGKISKDLPSCWECPKCYQGKGSASESSSDEESGESEGSNSLPGDITGGGEAGKRSRRGKPVSRPTAPPPSQRLLLQHQQSRKRASALELQLRKRIKLERSKIMAQKRVALERSGSRLLSRLRSPNSRLSLGRGRGVTWASGSSFPATAAATGELEKPPSLNGTVSFKGRGRGVRLRGGAVGRGFHSRDHGPVDDSEDSSSSSSSNSSSTEEEDEDEEAEGTQNGSPGGDKENQPQMRTERLTTKDLEDEKDNQICAYDYEEQMEQDTQTEIKDGFNKVTLQVPSRAKQDPSAIVPKLEAIASTTTALIRNQYKALPRPPIRHPDLQTSRHTPPLTRSGRMCTHKTHQERVEASKRIKECKLVKLGRGGSASSSADHPRIPLSALQEGGSEADRESSGAGPACEREVWVSVFRYLSRADLCVCMAVCKNWYKWCLDKRLWTKIDLSIKPSVTPQALIGIIKRQPVTLDLSWTNISKKQLNWLIGRLPGLKDLMLAGCSWASISALCSPGCPLLRSLDLRYADGVKDAQIRELITPPGCDNRSPLRTIQSLRLSGLDISDSTVRLVIRHMPQLTKLDLSNCNSLSDHSINLLTAVGSSTRNTLTELNLAGCSKLSDTCLKYLRRLACITMLDLRGCKGVSRKACEAFISELSVNTLYCLSDEKLIERIS